MFSSIKNPKSFKTKVYDVTNQRQLLIVIYMHINDFALLQKYFLHLIKYMSL